MPSRIIRFDSHESKPLAGQNWLVEKRAELTPVLVVHFTNTDLITLPHTFMKSGLIVSEKPM